MHQEKVIDEHELERQRDAIQAREQKEQHPVWKLLRWIRRQP